MARSPTFVLLGSGSSAPILSTGEQGWQLTRGVKPFMAAFDIPRFALAGFLSKSGPANPLTLRMVGSDAKPKDFSLVYLVKNEAAQNPHMARIVLADRRFWWPYILVTKRYNMRRRVGSKRRGEFQDELQQDVVPEIQYAAYSLDGGKRWTARRIIEDVFTGSDGLMIPKAQFSIDASVTTLDGLPIDTLPLNDEGHMAAARALAAIPGTDVTVDENGAVRIYSVLTTSEAQTTGTGSMSEHGSLGPEIIGGGHVEFVSNDGARPKFVEVFFGMEVELRCDFLLTVAAGATVVAGDTPLLMDNVAPMPDFDLMVAGKRQYFGTYLPISQLLTAWTTQLPAGALITNLTTDIVNKAMVPGVNFFAALDLMGQLDADNARALWSARIAALRQHFRQTFRLSEIWRDNILTLKDYLVATIDIASGQRAPARAFADHSYIPSRKALIKKGRRNEDLHFAVNVSGYPGDKVEFGNTQPSPAHVKILDSDQGIVRIEYLVDPFGYKEMVLPAKILGDMSVPIHSFRKSDADHPIAMNAVSVKGHRVPRLDPNQRSAVLLTAVPASPNSKAQYYRIVVTPEDMQGILPDGLVRQLANAKGPTRQVFVGPGIETARIRWQEKARSLLSSIFGVGGRLEDKLNVDANGLPTDKPQTPRDLLKPHCVNDSDQDDIGDLNAASLPAIAKAVAASIWAQTHGRVQGSMTGSMRDARLHGSIESLRYYVDPTGATLVQANLPADISALDFNAFLPASTRNVIFKIPPGAV